jgi:uncharacterized membrane protein YdjX (TVP38/TMEM64 family)
MKTKRLILLLLVALAIASFFAFDLGRFLNLEAIKSRQDELQNLAHDEPWRSAAVFFLIYTLVTALSVPGAAILTLVAGAIFGLGWGTLIVSFASSVGATLAFLAARFILRDAVQQRFGDKLKSFNEGVARDGAFYLLTLRLVPLFPFFLINVLMGLTPMRTRTFYWVSQLGMLAGTLVYVNAGTQLARITSVRGILSPGLLLSFVLLGIFPLLATAAVGGLGKRVYRGRGQGESRADRAPQAGRRLPQYRLRAIQGADPLGQADVAYRPRARVRIEGRQRASRFRGRDGARAAHRHHHRAA